MPNKTIAFLVNENQALRNEVNRLKGEKRKPNIRGNAKSGNRNGAGNSNHSSEKERKKRGKGKNKNKGKGKKNKKHTD